MENVVIMDTRKYSEIKLGVMYDMEKGFEWFRPNVNVNGGSYVKFENWMHSASIEAKQSHECIKSLQDQYKQLETTYNMGLKNIRRDFISECEIRDKCVHYDFDCCGDFHYCMATRNFCKLDNFVDATYLRAEFVLMDEIKAMKYINKRIRYFNLKYEILNEYVACIKNHIYSIEGMELLEKEKKRNAIKGIRYEDLDEFLARISEEYDRTGAITSISATKL